MLWWVVGYVGVGLFFLALRLAISEVRVELDGRTVAVLGVLYGLFWPLVWFFRLTGMGWRLVVWVIDRGAGL
jgi:hypothetical protein